MNGLLAIQTVGAWKGHFREHGADERSVLVIRLHHLSGQTGTEFAH